MDTTASPAAKGMAKEFKFSTGETGRSPGAMGIVKLRSQNLAQERAAIEKIKASADSITHADAETQDDAPAQDNTAAREPEFDVPPYLTPTSI
ncbi:hypothetical protein AOC05_04180 [Arthrobacter alpinus]|uniref:Uncharacterized protein n=1 Tax=Arthrobacter alpinus TaxID=656366 RepID=A0A0M4QLH6_9MICC|nr:MULTISPECIES: hypothetical protein [Arthrobacter]ALE91722.1 hypothetical protein AOC05_04180 [Arthrobacter alpinus]